MEIRSIGIDLGKTTFHLVALGRRGEVLVRRKFTQKQLLTYTANRQTCLIGLEACSGAHFLGRALRSQGHDVRLIPAQFVKPFVKSNKNDFVDAEAIAEAVERKNMRFVPIKTDDQLDLQAIHRVRDRLIARRTAVINQLRAFLLERGMVFAKTPAKLRMAMPEILENAESDLTPRMRNLLELLWGRVEDGRATDRSTQPGTETYRGYRCRLQPHPADSRDRADRRHRYRCGNWQRSRLPQGPRVCRLARACSQAILQRRQGPLAGYKQAREPIPAQNPGAWRPRRCSPYQARPSTDRSMDGRA
jgi:Transposase